jgi:two-component system nitrogen regulation response regulator GlnG
MPQAAASDQEMFMAEEIGIAKLPVLLVDDEPALLRSASMALRTSDFAEVLTCDDSRLVLSLLEQRSIGVVLLDLAMPNLSGQQLLQEVAANHPEVPVIVMTATNDLEVAVQCMQDGAIDYLLKPVDKSRLVSAVRRAFEMRSLRAEVRILSEMALSEPTDRHEAFSETITQSADMLRIFRYLEAVATSAHPVLITGETGTGKELVAQAVHRISGRSGPFVQEIVGGLDDNIFNDTLFGHMRGAYTDASHVRDGLVKTAAGGTLFLDEIGDLTGASQVKLLSLLQDGIYRPLGSDKLLRSQARVVAATNRDLRLDRDTGKFRKDLYQRLAAHQVHLPPLRSRRGDVPLLVKHFLEKEARDLGKAVPAVPRELFQLLATYSFPGNVRDIKGMCEEAMVQHQGGVLRLQSFRDAIARDQRPAEVGATERCGTPSVAKLLEQLEPLPTLSEAEQALIDEAMRRADDNQGIAASVLGIQRTALNRRLVQQRKPDRSNDSER